MMPPASVEVRCCTCFFFARFCNTDSLFVNSVFKWHECAFVMFRRLHLSAWNLNPVEQGFLCSLGLHTQKAPASAQVAAAGVALAENGPDHDENEGGHAAQDFSPTQKYMEIVGPQHLATFLRTALICSDSHFPWMYHVTELLPAGSVAPVTGTLHDNEAPPSFILPAEDGTYTVLSGHPSGVTVRAATLTHRVFCLGYALTEPSRPGK
jgi:hypothetical protein